MPKAFRAFATAAFDAVVVTNGAKAGTKTFEFQSVFTQIDANDDVKTKKDSDGLKLTCNP